LYIKGARASFVQSLFEARPPKDGKGKAKYGLTGILEKTTLAFAGDANPEGPAGQAKGYKFGEVKTETSKAIIEVAKAKWGEAATETVDATGNKVMAPAYMVVLQLLKAQNRLPLHDGAEKANYPGYLGNLYMNGNNEIRPVVRNKNGAQIEAKDGIIYSGCYVDMVVDIWAQDNAHGRRVNASLLAVTFAGEGERLAGGASATDDDYAAIPQEAQAKAAATGGGAASLFSV
jgi:hypothetical protein